MEKGSLCLRSSDLLADNLTHDANYLTYEANYLIHEANYLIYEANAPQ